MHAIICIFDFMNFMLFIIKFMKFKPIIQFEKFELQKLGTGTVGQTGRQTAPYRYIDRACSANYADRAAN